MPIPGVLNYGTSYIPSSHDGTVEGVVAEHVDRLVITFTSGVEIDLEPFPGSAFGFKAFGLHFDGGESGQPTRIDVYHGDELTGTA